MEITYLAVATISFAFAINSRWRKSKKMPQIHKPTLTQKISTLLYTTKNEVKIKHNKKSKTDHDVANSVFKSDLNCKIYYIFMQRT